MGASGVVALLVVLLGVLALAASGVGALVISDFPHFQTFDYWPQCYESSTCLEKRCDSLLGGWKNQEFAFARVSSTGTDEFHWWVKSDTTPSNTLISSGVTFACPSVVTGPCVDATNGTGNYLYAEASGCFGAHFRVTTPLFYFTNASATLSYEYYMYGNTIVPASVLQGSALNPASLRVSVAYGNSTTFSTVLATHTGENPTTPGSPWIKSTIPITLPSFPIIAQFQFEATAPGSFTQFNASRVFEADIAIDNVLVTQLGASNNTVPYIDPVKNDTNTGGSSTGSGVVDGGDGLTGGTIAGIVIGIVAGLCCLCLVMLALGIGLLLLLSPRKKGSRKLAEAELQQQDAGAGNDDL